MTDRENADVLRIVNDGTEQTALVATGLLQVLDLAVGDSCVCWTAFSATTSGVYVAPR